MNIMHFQTSQNQQVLRRATNDKMGNTLLSHYRTETFAK
jgi:hypothetical protein